MPYETSRSRPSAETRSIEEAGPVGRGRMPVGAGFKPARVASEQRLTASLRTGPIVRNKANYGEQAGGGRLEVTTALRNKANLSDRRPDRESTRLCAKQSQLGASQMIANCCPQKGLGENEWISRV